MTDPLTAWEAHRATCHTITDSETLGDALAEEVVELSKALSGLLGVVKFELSGSGNADREPWKSLIDASDLALGRSK